MPSSHPDQPTKLPGAGTAQCRTLRGKGAHWALLRERWGKTKPTLLGRKPGGAEVVEKAEEVIHLALPGTVHGCPVRPQLGPRPRPSAIGRTQPPCPCGGCRPRARGHRNRTRFAPSRGVTLLGRRGRPRRAKGLRSPR